MLIMMILNNDNGDSSTNNNDNYNGYVIVVIMIMMILNNDNGDSSTNNNDNYNDYVDDTTENKSNIVIMIMILKITMKSCSFHISAIIYYSKKPLTNETSSLR